MSLEYASAAGLGLALGVVTGLPLGVVNVAIVDLARRDRRAAIGVGLGGALADTAHAAAAFGGLAAAVLARPDLAAVLALVSGVILAGYALWLLRATRAHAAAAHSAVGLGRGVVLGVSLTLPNPGALAAWVTVAAALAPPGGHAGALACALGVGVGSAAWFVTLAVLVARGGGAPTHRPWLRRVVAASMLVIAALAIARGVVGLT